MTRRSKLILTLMTLCGTAIGVRAANADTADMPGERQVSIDLAFKTHLDMGLPEQDVFIERAAGSGDVYRVTNGDNNMRAELFKSAVPVPHNPFSDEAIGPHPKGERVGMTLREFERLFHDGRVETDPDGNYEAGFITPAKWKLPTGLDNVLAAQAMFPVTSPAEMAGNPGENPVADAVFANNADFWRATGLQMAMEDYGRGRVTFRTEDRYKFRTPSLRNVALTGPWGHAGAYDSLEDVVRHHLDPVASLHAYRPPADHLPVLDNVLEVTAKGASIDQNWLSEPRRNGYRRSDTWVQSSEALRERIAAANELAPQQLDDGNVADLIAFLDSLTDARAKALDYPVPEKVPSGLPIVD